MATAGQHKTPRSRRSAARSDRGRRGCRSSVAFRRIAYEVLEDRCLLSAGDELPRIAVQNGAFVNVESGQAFVPWGFNYVRLDHTSGSPSNYHSVFEPAGYGLVHPGGYDAAAAEAMLESLHAQGFNTVRVFIDSQKGHGIADESRTAFSATYIDNFTDFLSRARANQIYVMPTMTWMGDLLKYFAIMNQYPATPARGSVNVYYVDSGGIAARAQYYADIAAAIKDRDPSLLTTILSYDLENELYMQASSWPFNQADGVTVTGPDGLSYTFNTAADRQALADACFTMYMNNAAAAVRAVDPDALIGASAYTFDAVGRSGPGDIRNDKSDTRFPADLRALVDSSASHLDLHLYPSSDPTVLQDGLASVGWPQLKADADAHGLPFTMAEYGAHISRYATIGQAESAMTEHVQTGRSLDFGGFVYWTYDASEQTSLWNAASSGGRIFTALSGLSNTVTNVSDAPMGTDATRTMLENGVYTFEVADFAFTDPWDSPPDDLSQVRITTLPSAGSLRLGATLVTAGQWVTAADIAAGHLTFAPEPNASGDSYATFAFQVQDDGGAAAGGVDLDSTPNAFTMNVTGLPQIVRWESALNHGALSDVTLAMADDAKFSEPRTGGVRRLMVTFDRAIAPESFTAGSVLIAGNDRASSPLDLSSIAISVSLAGGNTQGIIDFSANLPDRARYLVRLQGIADPAGNALYGDNDRVFTNLKGDSSNDLRTNVTDLSYIQSGTTTSINRLNIKHVRSDVNLDGRVNVTDLSASWAARNVDARNIATPILPAENALAASVTYAPKLNVTALSLAATTGAPAVAATTTCPRDKYDKSASEAVVKLPLSSSALSARVIDAAIGGLME